MINTVDRRRLKLPKCLPPNPITTRGVLAWAVRNTLWKFDGLFCFLRGRRVLSLQSQISRRNIDWSSKWGRAFFIETAGYLFISSGRKSTAFTHHAFCCAVHFEWAGTAKILQSNCTNIRGGAARSVEYWMLSLAFLPRVFDATRHKQSWKTMIT